MNKLWAPLSILRPSRTLLLTNWINKISMYFLGHKNWPADFTTNKNNGEALIEKKINQVIVLLKSSVLQNEFDQKQSLNIQLRFNLSFKEILSPKVPLINFLDYSSEILRQLKLTSQIVINIWLDYYHYSDLMTLKYRWSKFSRHYQVNLQYNSVCRLHVRISRCLAARSV